MPETEQLTPPKQAAAPEENRPLEKVDDKQPASQLNALDLMKEGRAKKDEPRTVRNPELERSRKWRDGLTDEDFKNKEERTGWTEWPTVHTKTYADIMKGKDENGAATSDKMVAHLAKILATDGLQPRPFGTNAREYQDIRSAFALACEAGKQEEFTKSLNAELKRLGSQTHMSIKHESHWSLLGIPGTGCEEDILHMGHKRKSGAVTHDNLLIRKWWR